MTPLEQSIQDFRTSQIDNIDQLILQLENDLAYNDLFERARDEAGKYNTLEPNKTFLDFWIENTPGKGRKDYCAQMKIVQTIISDFRIIVNISNMRDGGVEYLRDNLWVLEESFDTFRELHAFLKAICNLKKTKKIIKKDFDEAIKKAIRRG